MNGHIEAREVVLDRLAVKVQQRVTEEIGASMGSTVEWVRFMEHLTDSMVLALRAEVLANKVDDRTVGLRVESPRSPWQARKLRARELPTIHTVGQLLLAAWTWAFPVKSQVREESHTFKVYDTYPHAAVALPKPYGQPVRVVVYEPPYWEAA